MLDRLVDLKLIVIDESFLNFAGTDNVPTMLGQAECYRFEKPREDLRSPWYASRLCGQQRGFDGQVASDWMKGLTRPTFATDY
ncbi:MAG: hypothetical protein ACI9G1_005756 [Pirellulaceae bacterium]